MAKYQPIEQQQREEFILRRLKQGLSFAEVNRQFCSQFKVGHTTSARWISETCWKFSTEAGTSDLKIFRWAMLEQLHDQIVGYQNDLVGMQQVLDEMNQTVSRRCEILAELEKVQGQRQTELLQELSLYPDINPKDRAEIVEAKSRIRERLAKTIAELARMQGVRTRSNWRAALNILLDHSLIPVEAAETILQLISGLENKIQNIK